MDIPSAPDTLPLFPLGQPLFPGGLFPLRIFEARYVDMTRRCLREDQGFGIVLIKAGFEVGQPAIPHAVGCLARIIDWDVPGPGLFRLQTQGSRRFRIRQTQRQADGLLLGTVDWLPDWPEDLALPEDYAYLRPLVEKLLAALPPEAVPEPRRLDDATWLACRLAECLPVIPERRQALLECASAAALLAGLEAELKAVASD